MANLTFRSILATGHIGLGERAGPGGVDLFDYFHDGDIELTDFEDHGGLLVLATKRKDYEKCFITFNAPAEVSSQSYEDAKDERNYFVSCLHRNPSDIWTLQIHRVNPGILVAGNNDFAIHARNENGEPSGNRDNFYVAGIFLFYFGAE